MISKPVQSQGGGETLVFPPISNPPLNKPKQSQQQGLWVLVLWKSSCHNVHMCYMQLCVGISYTDWFWESVWLTFSFPLCQCPFTPDINNFIQMRMKKYFQESHSCNDYQLCFRSQLRNWVISLLYKTCNTDFWFKMSSNYLRPDINPSRNTTTVTTRYQMFTIKEQTTSKCLSGRTTPIDSIIQSNEIIN